MVLIRRRKRGMKSMTRVTGQDDLRLLGQVAKIKRVSDVFFEILVDLKDSCSQENAEKNTCEFNERFQPKLS